MQNVQQADTSALRDQMVSDIYARTEAIVSQTVTLPENKTQLDFDRRLDNVLTSRWLGYPIMLLMLGTVFYVTIAGANVPSGLLADFFFWIEGYLTAVFTWLGTPAWVHGVLIEGLYRGTAWVVSVMLPPMAIFFPVFAILEDFGYLPRVAFNLDRFFKKAGAHGKQALTMSMGFGCNAAGVTACRIIESPRERIIAIITNNFVPCNGRFPTLITLATLFMGGAVGLAYGSLVATGVVVGLVLIGISATLSVSWLLSKTLLRGIPSNFTLELPPYRKPQFGRLMIRSVYDRTIFVLKRAVIVAAPAGVATWILANIFVGDLSILQHAALFLDPFARAIGLDGYILMAFILGLPANEIVLPILIMSYLSTGAMTEMDSLAELKNLFLSYGWTWLTALCMMLFSLLHYPCGTTMWTIAKETKSTKWTLVAILLPTGIALGVCFLVAQTVRFFGWV
ncbi:nucleoside recognition domain-containing protein [Tumebacillus sp. BK434]|uniref:nucleoside recognition domain-containing protein n=1 Tax=Tumebacillus sp. BK434 TaxID=2512169 RepID=UPI001047630D|nr:nucleoside recognition domain-containing protein [Tumebacillus sp. BK434]